MDDRTKPNVLGTRWELGPARPLHGRATSHVARLESDEHHLAGLAEMHPVPDSVDAGTVVAEVSRSTAVEDQHLIEVLDVGVVGQSPVQLYIVTESWDELLDSGPHGEIVLRDVAAATASGLAALHGADRLHGGLHRASLRRVDDVWKLAPAGLASVTQTDIAPYRPPGLHVMELPSAAADLWNLGVILHELANGRLLHPGETPVVASVPVIDHLVGRLLQRDPDTRPSAEEVRDLLDRTPIGERPPEPASETKRSAMIDLGRPDIAGGSAGANQPPRSEVSATAEVSAEAEVSATAEVGNHADPTVRALGRASGSPTMLLAGSLVAAVLLIGGVLAVRLFGGDAESGDRATGTTAGATAGDTAGPTTLDEPGADGGSATSAERVIPADGVVGLASLVEGDCIEASIGQGVFTTAVLLPCDTEHRAEVIAIAEPPSAGLDVEYPGRRSLSDFGVEVCNSRFEPYVGSSVLDTVLAYQAVVPTFGEWQSAERQSVVCIVTRFDGGTLDRPVAGGYQHFRIIEGSATSVGKVLVGKCFNVESGGLSSIGKRQDVTVVGCLSLHDYEVFDLVGLPLDERDDTGLAPTTDRYDEFEDLSLEDCSRRWVELAPLAGAGSAEVRRVLPDEFDWQVGDRFYLCVIAWDKPIAFSVVLNNNLVNEGVGGAAQTEDDEENGLADHDGAGGKDEGGYGDVG